MFRQNKLLVCLVLILLQIFSSFSLPVKVNERSYTSPEEIQISIYFEKPENWGEDVYVYMYSDYVNELPYDAGRPLEKWPGKKMYHEKKYNRYNSHYAFKYFNHNSYVIFSDGEHQVPGVMQKGFMLSEDGLYDENGLKDFINHYDEKVSHYVSNGNTIKLFYVPNPTWKDVLVHYKIGNGEWTEEPMIIFDLFEKKHHHTFNIGEETEITVCFTDGHGQWDNNNGKNYVIKAPADVFIGKL